MKVLVVGKGIVTLEAMRLAEAGYGVGVAPNEHLARMSFLGRCPYDLILLLGCECLEEGDLSAERLKGAAAVDLMQPPFVFVLWRATAGFDRGADYGLKAIDMLIEDLSVERVMQAYECIKNDTHA